MPMKQVPVPVDKATKKLPPKDENGEKVPAESET